MLYITNRNPFHSGISWSTLQCCKDPGHRHVEEWRTFHTPTQPAKNPTQTPRCTIRLASYLFEKRTTGIYFALPMFTYSDTAIAVPLGGTPIT